MKTTVYARRGRRGEQGHAHMYSCTDGRGADLPTSERGDGMFYTGNRNSYARVYMYVLRSSTVICVGENMLLYYV